MGHWIQAARPKTLVAGAVPVLIGTAMAYKLGGFSAATFLSALMSALLIQVATNFVNDAADFQKGADTSDRLGPPRMAASGALSVRALYAGAGVAFLVACIFGAVLIAKAGLVILWIGVASVICGIIYTAGPFPLAYLGLGDLFVFIFFGLVAVVGTTFAHMHSIPAATWPLAIASGLQSTALIAINNLRDIPTDRAAGKKTFAVYLGEQGSRFYYLFLMLMPFFLWLPFAASLHSVWGFLPYAAVPLTSRAVIKCFQITDRKEYNVLLGRTALIHFIFGSLVSLALVAS